MSLNSAHRRAHADQLCAAAQLYLQQHGHTALPDEVSRATGLPPTTAEQMAEAIKSLRPNQITFANRAFAALMRSA